MKGHWPKGRRRNPEEGVKLLRVQTRRLLRHTQPGLVSQRALARSVGVDIRTVGRWLRGEDCPSAASCRKWQKWLDAVINR